MTKITDLSWRAPLVTLDPWNYLLKCLWQSLLSKALNNVVISVVWELVTVAALWLEMGWALFSEQVSCTITLYCYLPVNNTLKG